MATTSGTRTRENSPARAPGREPGDDRPEPQPPSPNAAPTPGTADAERRMVHHLLVSTAVAIRVLVVFCVAVIALALGFTTDVDVGPPLLMGAGIEKPRDTRGRRLVRAGCRDRTDDLLITNQLL